MTLLLIFLFISFAINFWTWVTLFRLRAVAREQLDALAVQLQSAQQDTVQFDIPVRQAIPISAEVPIEKSIAVPINLSVPINETFNVPLETPFGTYQIPVPIDVEVPISTTVPVEVSEVIAVSTIIELDLTVPIRIPIAGSPLEDYLNRLHREIIRLRDYF